jgi:hypothetical protein
MFFVILTMVFIAAIIGDFSKARFFRLIGRMPDTRNELDKATKLFMLLLVAFMTWAQSKDSMPSGGGEWLSGEALEAIESEYYYSLPEEESGIAWALLTGNPPFTSNAVLTASQFQAGFACVSVTDIQPSALAAPANAVTFTNWPYAVARQAVLLPQGCIPQGFTFGGRPVTNLYMAASGILSFDGPKSSPIPTTNGIPDGTALNYLAVLQTPSDIVPTNGIFWYATGTNSSVFTWKDVFLGQDINCLATVQAELYPNGDFTCRYSFPSPTYSYSSIPDGLLIGAQNNPGGETVLHTNNLLAVHSAFMSAFELRWKSLAGLNPAVADHDEDSLSTADELFIHRTDPRNRDSDGDALTDGEEVSFYSTDPTAFSSDASGQGDLWRILGGLGPSDAPYTNAAPSASVGILTVTTLLENAPTNGAAILRIANQYIPVLAGTTLVSRIAVPRDMTNLFILARGVNCDNAIAHVTLEASAFTKIRDPSGVFSGPLTLSPSCVTASGEVLMPAYTLTPSVVCFHCPTSAVIRVTSADPDVWLATEYGMLRDYSPQPFGFPETFTNGLIQLTLASTDTTLFILAASTNIPAHFCNLHGQETDEYPSGQSYTDWCRFENGVHVHAPGFSETNCPCLVFTNAFECPCSGDGRKPCTCAHAVSDPKAMPQDGSATNVLGHAVLKIGGTNDLLEVEVAEGTYWPCPLCACASEVPSSASVYRQTHCIEVTPGSLTADGAFSVAGLHPSTNFADTVFIYKVTDYSGPETVTSYTRKDYTVLGTAVYPTDQGHSVSNWFIGYNVTNAFTLWTGVALPSDTGDVTLSVSVESGSPMPQLYIYNRVAQSNELLVTQEQLTFTQNLGDWRDTYCDTNGYAQAYLLCASGGVGRVTYSYETYSGQPYDAAATADQLFTAWGIEFVHAEGELAGLPMRELPVFTPFSGAGKGVPIYDSPGPDLTLALAIAQDTNILSLASMAYLGIQYSLSETSPGSLLFTNELSSVEVSGSILADTNVVETLTAFVSVPLAGITNAVYSCQETNAVGSIFENERFGIIASLSGLSSNETDNLLLHLSSEGGAFPPLTLAETTPDSRCFAATGIVVRLLGDESLTVNADELHICLTVDATGLSNTVFTVLETGGQTLAFRNYAPPVPTDAEDSPVPAFAPWRIRIAGISDPGLLSQATLSTADHSLSQISFSQSGGGLLSDEKFVIVPTGALEIPVPNGYTPLRIDPTESCWWNEEQQGVSVEVCIYPFIAGCTRVKTAKERAGAIVLESLDWTAKMVQTIDTKGRIASPLEEMQYAVYADYHASATNVLAKHVKGKQVWYSLSHGGLEYGRTDSQFMGLAFLNNESVMRSDLLPLNLDYRLVMVDGCCSAQTTADNPDAAYACDTLAQTVEEFADSFGPKVAYMGWAWTMYAGRAQYLTGRFLQLLRYENRIARARSVHEAHLQLQEDTYVAKYENKQEAKLMKLYGNVENVIDISIPGGGQP